MSVRSSIASLAVVALLGGCGRSEAGSGAGNGTGDGARKGEPLRVAAASDLATAFAELRTSFEATSGKKVEITFGSTGLLAKQIAEGAPFDVFAAANVSFVDDVVKAGACAGETKALYARGRLAIWTRDASKLPKDIRELADPRYAKVSIANPEHAPYGRAAREALTRVGAWPSVATRTVHGENVQQALVYARTGNADAAIVALSLAVGTEGSYLPIDPALHEPLDQALVVCDGGARGHAGRHAKKNEARAFVDFVTSEAGHAVMRRHGFLLPGESLAAE
jgi:molybdate transport system substrate-binding protein